MSHMHLNLVFMTVGLLGGCVSAAAHDSVVAESLSLRSKASRLEVENARCVAALGSERRRSDADTSSACNAALDDEVKNAQAMRQRMRELGETVDDLRGQKGSLSFALQLSRARIALLQRTKIVAERRAQLHEDLVRRFQRMIDAGDLQVLAREHRMVIVLPNDILFTSGSVVVTPKGRESLRSIATVLEEFPERHFQVAGHTDSVPIATSKYPSNWELSAGRAISVTRFLLEQGVSPHAVSAAGYGEFDPIRGNDSELGRSQNRRIEITLVPQIDEIVALPDELRDAAGDYE